MKKVWKKSGESTYTFLKDSSEFGTLELLAPSKETKAYATIRGELFAFRERGFWKKDLQVINSQGMVVASITQKKWYSSLLQLDFKGNIYTIMVRNRPLAEWVLTNQVTELLLYGLKSEIGNVGVVIQSKSTDEDDLFDFLLWYLFLPTITENSRDSIFFELVG